MGSPCPGWFEHGGWALAGGPAPAPICQGSWTGSSMPRADPISFRPAVLVVAHPSLLPAPQGPAGLQAVAWHAAVMSEPPRHVGSLPLRSWGTEMPAVWARVSVGTAFGCCSFYF